MQNRIQRALAVTAIAIATQSGLLASAFAQVSVNIQIGPPAPIYEQVPTMAPGYVWAPGYWAWHDDRHIWVRGRTMVQRVGYRWQPDVWVQRNNTYYRHSGRWELDNSYRAPPRTQMFYEQAQAHDGPRKKIEHGNSRKPRKNDNKDEHKGKGR